jgi:putative ABC transport system ATP-binding protein
MKTIIEAKNIARIYRVGEINVKALDTVNLTVEEGEFVSIMGSSGSGKSTLMNILGCLDKPTSGEYFLDGERVSSLTKNEYATIRNEKIGFVFQVFNLLPRTTALENVKLPLFYDRSDRKIDVDKAAREALDMVGLSERISHEPNQLSGGQQQRVALARALINKPAILLADEPTGNLDSRTSVEVLALFQELNGQGKTIILVTHEQEIAEYTKRVVRMRDGLIIEDKPVTDQRDARSDLEAMTETVETPVEKLL